MPASRSAHKFVDQGADEIQHISFIELNFLFPELKETRNRDRFIEAAECAREFTLKMPEARHYRAFSEPVDLDRLEAALDTRPDAFFRRQDQFLADLTALKLDPANPS